MSEHISVELSLIKNSKDELLALQQSCPAVWSKVVEHFLNPLANQNCVAHLRGKYKPSWIVPRGVVNPLRYAMAEQYKRKSLYHYHFGYPFYTLGRDLDFPGDESEGILHTVFEATENSESHVLLKVDKQHPHPFSAPIHLLSQLPTRSY